MITLRGPSSLRQAQRADLEGYWWDLAIFLNGKVDRSTGKLPPLYQTAYEACRDEFAFRGVQLQLW